MMNKFFLFKYIIRHLIPFTRFCRFYETDETLDSEFSKLQLIDSIN